MRILTLRNRYPKKPFKGMFDGVPYEFTDKLTLPEAIARHLYRQSIIRDNPITGEQEYRLSIVEEEGPGEDLTELPRETLDRSDFDSFRKVEIVEMGAKAAVPVRRAGGSEVRSKDS